MKRVAGCLGVFAASLASLVATAVPCSSERLGLEASGGMVRVGLAHYNTPAEIERLGAALQRLAAS